MENARIGPCLIAAISQPMAVTASDIKTIASSQSSKAPGNQVKNGTASFKSITIIIILFAYSFPGRAWDTSDLYSSA